MPRDHVDRRGEWNPTPAARGPPNRPRDPFRASLVERRGDGSGLDGEVHAHGGALTFLGAHPDLTAVPVHDRGDDRQAHAGSLDRAFLRRAGPEEPGEQLFLLLGRDAESGVTDLEHRLVVLTAYGAADRTAVLGELQRVA